MTVEALAGARNALPFLPFTIRPIDGRSIPVPAPEFVAFNRKGRMAAVADDREGFELIDLSLVVSLDFAGRPAGGAGD